MTAWNPEKVRQDFVLLRNTDRVYFDNAATSQKPQCVLDAVEEFYQKYNANVLRGLYPLSVEATERYEAARRTVQRFIHAACPEEIIFTRNATESMNLVAYSYGLSNLREGDEIVVSIMEHHSNLLPWQMVARQTGAVLKFLECTQEGTLPDEVLEAAITEKTKLVAVAQVSNVLGCVNPVEKIVKLAHEKGKDKDFALYSMVEQLAPKIIGEERHIYKGVSANVDFYSGFVYSMLDLPTELFTPMFAIARIVGWSAHRMEELINMDKIIRPAYKTVKAEEVYLPLEDR